MTALTLELPYPPTVNHYWKHTRNGIHYVTKQGKAYQSAVVFLAKNTKKFTGKVALNVEIYPPDNRKRDIDNIFKALFDSLTYAGVISDDSLINKLTAEKFSPVKDGKVVIKIKELE
ncbi:RusA family crossover junction endodeoxyribonuclease [Pasteurella caecimuris]|uniref:RusA family crossover junction endodeoxyribonuclease n=1 Tax=Rodentibacter caecimuris TaxID=1796644 RepID=UPI00214FF6A6|nr:RusA family crossover junction endodeoxyribonuclease [Pasteurella caecimuris]MCR1838439.1 RusA family crossover junction endodeoxyribonuclease [Pasteurella caecimuris]MCU0107731.1 RusA family crossover junction endodeoxyribonuclease [Pasteurella caecimuris]